MKYCILVYKTIFILSAFIILTTIYDNSLYAHGFFSQSSKKECRAHYSALVPPENSEYKSWCEDKFTNGSLIYEAYRQVAFSIKYAQEPPYNDFWQTPLETFYRHAGDCEDAALLFNNILPHQFFDGMIMWGVIKDLKNDSEYAHVWTELCDKNGQLYLVEPFTKDWDGIIPIDLVKNKKIEKRIIGIPCRLINDLLNNHIDLESVRRSVVNKRVIFDQTQNRLIEDIFAKLQRVSLRYIDQKRIIEEQNKR